MKRKIEKIVFFSWRGSIFSLDFTEYFLGNIVIEKCDTETFLKDFSINFISNEMHRISKNSVYAQKIGFLKDFCEDSLKVSYHDYFSFFLIFFHKKKLSSFLLSKILFDCVDLEYFCVSKNYRKKTISTKTFLIFEYVCKLFSNQSIRKVFLEVSVENKVALFFYKKMSFRENRIRKKYYQNGEDAIVMEKTL